MPIGFRGQIYAATSTATNNNVRRVVTSELKLSKCIVHITAQPQYVGHATIYPVYYAAGERFELMDIDLSTLYFCNVTAGKNGIARIVGVYAD
jgi:hypothetical protein